MLHSPATPALHIDSLFVNLGLDIYHEVLWEEGGWLEIILKMSFPSGVPLAVSSEISPCCFLPNRLFSLCCANPWWIFLMCMMKEQFCTAAGNMQSSKWKIFGENCAQKEQYSECNYCWGSLMCWYSQLPCKWSGIASFNWHGFSMN